MIAVAEPPLEFIPRGRQAALEHPGPNEKEQNSYLPSEHLLLQRLQNVNISSSTADEQQEFWCVREIYNDCELYAERIKQKKHEQNVLNGCTQQNGKKAAPKKMPPHHLQYRQEAMCDYISNNEEELYVNKHTVVWTRGLNEENTALRNICFTCETPVKFAFFCNRRFVTSVKRRRILDTQNDNDKQGHFKPTELESIDIDDKLTAICIIDRNTLRVYCSDGEDYLTNLEFPVSHVWPTRYGILLEKISANAVVQSLSIPMPRLFSVAHPLDEICPVLHKTATSTVNYLYEPEYNICYSAEDSDILLLYDEKLCKHFVSRLRKATQDEINYISSQNDQTQSQSSIGNQTLHRGSGFGQSFSQNSMKFTGATPKHGNTSNLGRCSFGASFYSPQASKLSQSFSGFFNHLNRTSGFGCTGASAAGTSSAGPGTPLGAVSGAGGNTPLSHLQSTIGGHTMSMHDIRKMGQVKPAKPIVPDLCLEHIWTENTYGTHRDFCEMATRCFIHTDLVGQTYLCYLLPRSFRLQMVRLSGYGTADLQISTMPVTISAKDAVCLDRTRMMVVLDPAGLLIIYTGTVLVSRVHIVPGKLLSQTPITKKEKRQAAAAAASSSHMGRSPNTSFPRRSSLLPSVPKSVDKTFEEELHLLSPVHPLQPHFVNRNVKNVCLSLRDPAGNRLTLVYSSGKMLRISLPLLNESKIVSRCITALRQILIKEHYLQFIIRWYSARNPPGSRDFSIEQEWQLFRSVLLSLMGCTAAATYHDNQQDELNYSNAADEPKKRRKHHHHHRGNDDDWDYMLHAMTLGGSGGHIGVSGIDVPYVDVDNSAPLFVMLPAIFYSFHLLYEDIKLDSSMHDALPYMVMFLHQLSVDMQLSTYAFHYIMDYPELVHKTTKISMLTHAHGAQMLHQELLQVPAMSVYSQVEHILKNQEVLPYQYIIGVNDRSRNVLQVISLIVHGHEKIKTWIKPLEFTEAVQSHYPKKPKRYINIDVPRSEQVLQMLINMDIQRSDIQRLPAALQLIISESLEQSRLSPPLGATAETYELILRSELVEHAKIPNTTGANWHKSLHQLFNTEEDSLSPRCPQNTSFIHDSSPVHDDGMENIDTKLFRLRFPDDMRVDEVRRLLNSADPVPIDVVQSPGTSDHELIEEQEKQLYSLCTRTMTLPMGRGMFTLRTSIPAHTENMPIPKLCLSGRETTKGTTIEMQQIEFPANMHLWPSFHNGVAAGLKVTPHAVDIDSTWIVFNRPKTQPDISTEHAGFLMALGLNGHLKSLSFMSIYEYLVKCDEMTSVGLLLGISATHRGTMNSTTTKLLSVHIEALLPATALELDIPQNIQVAALMGIGLLYQGSAKRHIAEVLLQEIGRPPGPEMENSVERESYALAAGLALGLVTLGQGETPSGLRDLQLPDTLHYYMVGGNKRLLAGAQKEKYRLASFQVREGVDVNIDVTAPGATLALGLMFFNTNNMPVADWMAPPSTRYLLDLVRPDLLLLRTISRGLILWDEIDADEKYLYGHFPPNLRQHLDMPKNIHDHDIDDHVDYEAIAQAYCNIVAGAAFCIGLKYAGTENPTAFKTLRAAIKQFLCYPGKHVGEYAGRTTIENCLMILLLALSLVFAGSGDLEILRLIRYFRSRTGPQHPQVTYGSHVIIHMSLGLLFLGAGRYSIAKSPEAVAALVCAFFPKFPIHSNDNRYHLQAFRHLYVLAVEPRLFLPRDIDTKQLCLCHISVLEVGSSELRRMPMAPCILPELSTLQKVIVDDENYWPVYFEKGRNWEQLVKALENCACIDIKKRTGCLSHLDDPDRLKSLLAQTLTTEQYLCWDIDIKDLQHFASDRKVTAFSERFLQLRDPDDDIPEDDEITITNLEILKQQQLTILFYNAVIKDKMHVLPIYLTIYDHISHIRRNARLNDIWQIKLIDIYLSRCEFEHILVSPELLKTHVEIFERFIEDAIRDLGIHLRKFITSTGLDPNCVTDLTVNDLQRMLAVVNYYNITPNLLNAVDLSSGPVNYLRIIYEFKKLNIETDTIYCLIKILRN